MSAPMKAEKKGAPIKDTDPNEDPKKVANRMRQRKFKEKMGKQVGAVVDDLDKCDEERAELKVEKAELTDKVKSLTTLLKNCDDQVADILKSVKDMKNIKGTKKDTMGAKTKAKPATALQKEAGSVISYAVKGALARKKMVM